MTDERLAAAVTHWASRFIANGIDYNDFRTTTDRIDRWEDWLDEWTQTAQAHLALAEQADARGGRRSAGEAYVRAAVCFHFSKFVWVLDRERNHRNTRSAIAALAQAHERLDPTAERVEAPIDGGRVVANLRRPDRDRASPLVVLIPGLDSTKEEFFHWENVFLDRGMATLSVDGPGQGEVGFDLDIRPDYEATVGAVLDALSDRAELDLDRVGAAGVSLGGYYVVRAAAFETRLRALASISGPFQFGADWETIPSLTRETIAHHTGAVDAAQARQRAQRLDLAGVAERVTQPSLIITGRRDRVIAWEQTRRIADAVPGAEWVLYDDGTHVCNNIPFKYRPLVADWLAARLRA
jgi:pimeloyl-ACP methyl ester carboxylesterase